MNQSSIVRRIPALFLAAALLLPLFACNGNPPDPSGGTEAPTASRTEANAPFSVSAYPLVFAEYKDYVGSVKPQVPVYSVSPGLGNIVNGKQFLENRDENDVYYWYHSNANLSKEAVALIEKNGFAVTDNRSWAAYFGVYEENRYNYIPSFITTDSALHTFHLMFDYVLKDLEQSKLHGILLELTDSMLQAALAQYEQLKGSGFENAAQRNVAYFSVAQKLLNPAFQAPAEAQELVTQEIALIEAHEGIQASPVINLGAAYANSRTEEYLVDYSQFVPRIHYTQSEKLKQYFKAMQWYGQITFRSNYEDEVKSALLLTAALYSDEKAKKAWVDIFEPTSFFVGECDDITPFQYQAALEGVYGKDLSDLQALTDGTKFQAALKIIRQMEPPAINSVPIWEDVLDRVKATAGLRFMGRRFTIDAAIFQRLMHRDVTDRMLPNSLDIPSALGSDEARDILKPDTDNYPDYNKRMGEVKTYLGSMAEKTWYSNLYWSWMHMLRPFAGEQKGTGYPFFMQNSAWTRKELNSFQGSWTELKRDTLLYAKQPMGELGGSGDEPPPPPDDRGYVEPNPVVFGRLAALVKLTTDGLRSRKLLTDLAEEALDTLYEISQQLTAISEKELENKTLTDKEYDFIHTYGGELEHIWQTAKKDELEAAGGNLDQFLEAHPDAVIADVATDPNGLALEEATGYAKEIYVAFPRDGKVLLARGVVYSQYEFTVPLAKRMTDEDWHQQLRGGEAPPYADWKKAFIADITADGSDTFLKTR